MIRRVAIAVAVLCATGHAAAPAGAPPPDVKAQVARAKRCMSELSAHVSKVTFDRKDVERLLAEWRSFDALDVAETQGDAPEGPECVDLAAAVADPKYVAWARARGLDPMGWLLKSLRITVTHAKRGAPAQAAELKAQLDAQRGELEKHCASMGPEACRELEKAFASGEEMARETAAMMALLPEPTRAEAALLAEYDGRLREVIEGPRGGRDFSGAGAEDLPPEVDEGK